VSDSSDDIDLSQFSAIFFEEAGENIEQLEAKLLALDVANVDDEELNAIFRCAHSVKGGAATFGFRDVAELTHEAETLLDKLRRHELAATTEMIDVLLAANDALRAMIARHQGDGSNAVDNTALIARLRELVNGQAAPAAAPVAETPAAAGTTAKKPAARKSTRKAATAQTSAGDAQTQPEPASATPPPATLAPAAQPASAPAAPPPAAPPPTAPALKQDAGFGLFDGAPGTPQPRAAAPAAPAAKPAGERAASADSATLRVPVEKVDQLINLVGELVITQAMLAQSGVGLDTALHQRMSAGLADLERNTRSLQEAVMSIRMIPMSVVFNRFPRMLRDLATKLGKTVELETVGEATELDKGLVEKITDPLTHLVRNSCDHGIELPAQRLAAGKPANGTITLAASHQGGSIVIEVRDDGRGLNRDKLLKKARERGLDAPDSLSDQDVWGLIFAPGFSTAEQITDVSGRGVGMDVVKKNITALGGTVEIESTEGRGMSVKVRLPLTLAIMDGMSVAVGEESYILPLGSIVESFQPQPEQLQTIAGRGRVVRVRDEYLPVVDLDRLMSVPRDDGQTPSSILVVVEAEGSRVALRVDELLGQQQVVVKNIEENYRRVEHVAGATILGDGRVALILDTGSLARPAMH
jgi:two-component system, chemotaxis family, sensor kinase CheA